MADKMVINIDGDDSGLEKSLTGVKGKAQKLGSAISSGFGVAVKGVAAFTAGVGVAGAAMTGLSVKSLTLAGDLEQNIGGAETVFKDLGGSIGEITAMTQKINNATGEVEWHMESLETVSKDAYKNMGLSQSNYLATANKMGALFKGAGFETQEAMDLSSKAMQRAADVASIMGLDTASAMEAVAGAAKGNFTMMDNLGVAMNETTLANYALEQGMSKSYDQMTQQEKIGVAMEMFLNKTAYAAGNYAKENETLAGALGTAKSAISNFLAGKGTPEEVIASLSNAGDVIANNLTTLLPKLTAGIVDIINQLAPMLPQLIQQLLPVIVQSVTQLADSFGGLVAQIIVIITEQMPQLINAAIQILQSLGTGLMENMDVIIPSAIQAIVTLVNGIITNLPTLLEAAIQIIMTLADGIAAQLPTMVPTIIAVILKIVETLLDNLDELVIAAIDIIVALAEGLIQSLPELVRKVPVIIQKLVQALTDPAILAKLIAAAIELTAALAEGIIKSIPALIAAGIELIVNFIANIKENALQIVDIGKDMVEGLWKGITNTWDWLVTKIKEWCNDILDKIKDVFGIRSPSRVMRDEVGAMITEGIAVGIEKAAPTLEEGIQEQKQMVVDNYKAMVEEVCDSIGEIAEAQKSLAQTLMDNSNHTFTQFSIIEKGEETVYTKLADMTADNNRLEQYSNLLDRLYEKRNVLPDNLSETLAGMEIEDAMTYVGVLLDASDEEFDKYIADLEKNQQLAEKISQQVYKPETEELAKSLEAEFGQLPEDFFEIGEESAEQYGEGFMNQLKAVFEEVKSRISVEMQSLSAQLAIAGAGNVTTNTFTDARTTNIYASSASPREIIEEQKANDVYQQHTSKWGE